jgi:hypothetical protein
MVFKGTLQFFATLKLLIVDFKNKKLIIELKLAIDGPFSERALLY